MSTQTTRNALLAVLVSLTVSMGDGIAADIKAHAIKLSYPVAKDNPVGLSVTRFAEIVGEKSDGKMKVTGYSDAQLGAEIQTMSSAQGGVLEMTVVSTAGAAGTVKEFAVSICRFSSPMRRKPMPSSTVPWESSCSTSSRRRG